MELLRIWKSGLLLLALFGTTSLAAILQTDHEREPSQVKYTLASFCGDYGIVGSYSGGIARALGTQTMDGHGNLTGSAIINDPDGTGKMALSITVQGGTIVNVTEDFVITKTRTANGTPLASEIQDAQEVPSVILSTPTLAFHTYTLRSAPKSCTQGEVPRS
jgi:hypothetical protein